jgi:hypothetical protein
MSVCAGVLLRATEELDARRAGFRITQFSLAKVEAEGAGLIPRKSE